MPPSKFAHAARSIFELSVVNAFTACPFSIKKCAIMSVFLCENRNNLLAAGCEASGC